MAQNAILPVVPPLNPDDVSVNHGIDFSDLLDANVTVSNVLGVTASPDGMSISSASLGNGKRGSCAALFAATPSEQGFYVVTASIQDTAGETLNRSIVIPVGLV